VRAGRVDELISFYRLGRCYAKAFAALGAAVIVSDIADPTPGVDEIRSAGGKAIGCQAACEDAQTIVDTAVEAYGRVDILINNAGFLRDKAFVNMDEQAWKDVVDVHLNGMYQMTKAVWLHFVTQGGGCIVNTASTSGIYGVFGQANYSAAVHYIMI
jgi:multifunctional beta-oxidation protein